MTSVRRLQLKSVRKGGRSARERCAKGGAWSCGEGGASRRCGACSGEKQLKMTKCRGKVHCIAGPQRRGGAWSRREEGA